MGRPWSYKDCPAEGLRMFGTTFPGCPVDRHVDCSGSKQVQQSARRGLSASSAQSGLRQLGSEFAGYLLAVSWMYASRVPFVRGCPKCGMLINHNEGCKHMTCHGCGHTKLMHILQYKGGDGKTTTAVDQAKHRCVERKRRGIIKKLAGPFQSG